MKKCTIGLLIIVIAATSMISAQAESTAFDTAAKLNTQYALLGEKGQAVLPDVSVFCWVSETGLFFLDPGTKPSLFHWTFDQNEVELIGEISLEFEGIWKPMGQEASAFSADESIIFSLADGLYGLVLKTGEIRRYVVHTNEWAHIGMLLVDDEHIDGLSAGMVRDVVRDGDLMYFLINSSEGIILLQLDLLTETCKILPNTCFQQIEPYASGTLLVSLDGNLHTYAPHTQTLGNALASVDPLSNAFAYDQGTDRLFFICNGDIYQKDRDMPMEMLRATEVRNENPSWSEDVQNVYGNAPVSFLLPLSNGSLAYHTGKLTHESAWGDPSGFLYVVRQELIPDAIKTLHIASAPAVATAFFQLTHPDVRIEHCIVGSGSQTQEANHFPDVFSRTTETDKTLPLYAREHMDLSESPVICEIMSRYDPKVLAAVAEGDKIFGLPWSVSVNTLDYDQKKWESIGLPDPPKTVDELFELIHLWDEQYADQHPDQPLLGNGGFFDMRYGIWTAVTEAYVTRYASGDAPVNFDTEEYRMLVQRIIDIPDVKYSEWGVLLRFFMAFDSLNYPFTQLGWKDGYTEYTSIPPLAHSDAQPLRVKSGLYYHCIAQDAQAPGLALEYLTFLAEFQMAYQPEVGFMMTGGAEQAPNMSPASPFFRSLPFVGMTSEGLSVLPHEVPGGSIGNETLDFYRSIFPALDFDMAAGNPAYAWGNSDMRLPWPTDNPNGELVCSVDELIAKMNGIAAQYFLH